MVIMIRPRFGKRRWKDGKSIYHEVEKNVEINEMRSRRDAGATMRDDMISAHVLLRLPFEEADDSERRHAIN